MVCGMHLRSREDWHLINSWFPLHYIHGFGMATAFVATEDKTEVLTVVMQAQLLLGYVVWVSEAEFGHAIETCANAAPPPPTNAFVITAHDWKDFIGSQIEGSIARGSTLSHASETFVDSRASNEDLDAETDLDSVAESDSDPDEEDDSDDSDDDEDDDGDTWPDGEEGSGFDGVAIDDLDGNKQLRPGTVALTIVESVSLSLFDELGIPASSSAGFLL